MVAQVLGLPLNQVRISSTDTDRVANASATAASSGTDLNGRAAERAALQVRHNLAACLAQADACKPDEVVFAQAEVHTPQQVRSFAQAVQYAYSQRVQLWSDGFYATPDIHPNCSAAHFHEPVSRRVTASVGRHCIASLIAVFWCDRSWVQLQICDGL